MNLQNFEGLLLFYEKGLNFKKLIFTPDLFGTQILHQQLI